MPDQLFTRIANAKINLALHVVGQRDDNYHFLDSLVCFVEHGDHLKISSDCSHVYGTNLVVEGLFSNDLGAGEYNLVTTATQMLATSLETQGLPCPPVTINLEKNLPIASGIGGGSADAAAALILVKQHWAKDLEIDLADLAIRLGADVPMCLNDQPKRVQGVGEKLSPFPLNVSLPILLVNPGLPLPTPQIFNLLENRYQPPINMETLGALENFEDVIEFIEPLRNDLQKPAITRCPVIQLVLDEISSMNGCKFSRMSGSGATCFGLFENTTKADAARILIERHHPDWWCRSTKTISCNGENHEHGEQVPQIHTAENSRTNNVRQPNIGPG